MTDTELLREALKALKFYADESHYPSMWLRNKGVLNDMAASIAQDCGERACETAAKIEERLLKE